MFSREEKLEVIERLIVRDLHEIWPDEMRILKSIAADLRAPEKADKLVALLDRAVDNAEARKTSTGYAIGNLQEIAQAVIGRWTVIRQALMKFGETP